MKRIWAEIRKRFTEIPTTDAPKHNPVIYIEHAL